MYNEFEQKLYNELMTHDITESTANKYIRDLQLLNDNTNFKNLNFLNKYDDIIHKLDDKADTTKRNYIISIISVLSCLKLKKKLYDKYYDKLTELTIKLNSDASLNQKNEKQKENWIDFKDIKEKLNDLKNDVLNIKNKNITQSDFTKIQRFIVLSLYVLNSPRRNQDYQYMQIVNTPKQATELDKNYYIHKDQKFYFRKYKTSKELKKNNETELIVDLSPELQENMNIYLKYHPLLKNGKITASTNVPLLVTYHGDKLNSPNAITYILNGIFKKKISVSMLRHIYLSYKYGDELKEQQQDAKNMSHSLQMQKEYIKN